MSGDNYGKLLEQCETQELEVNRGVSKLTSPELVSTQAVRLAG